MQPVTPKISLLWPRGSASASIIDAGDAVVIDLELTRFVEAIDNIHEQRVTLASVLQKFSDDPQVIGYRLDIVEDLLANSDLCYCLKELLPKIDELVRISKLRFEPSADLEMLISRIDELDLYIQCVNTLAQHFSTTAATLSSAGLVKLKEIVLEITNTHEFQSLVQELPQMKAGMEKLASVTIGVNLDAQLRPCEAVLLSINDQKYRAGTILERLMNKSARDKYVGVSSLFTINNGSESDEMQNMVFRQAIINSIGKILRSVIRPVAPLVAKYTRVSAEFLLNLNSEIVFLLASVQLLKTLQQSGLNICKPQVLAKADRKGNIKGFYNLNLALQKLADSETDLGIKIVGNDVVFNDQGRIYILTGPNQGGKTTYTQGVGLAQFMFQLGLYVPGEVAALSPVDNIFTHFPVEERPNSNLGRMGEECQRLQGIFAKATAHSLVLLNESLSSTSPGEGIYIAKEIVCGLKLLGLRGVYATHFHELGSSVDRINENVPGDSRLVSLVAGLLAHSQETKGFFQRSFRITPGVPQGMSYAKEIASQHGVSIEQIITTLEDREMIQSRHEVAVNSNWLGD